MFHFLNINEKVLNNFLRGNCWKTQVILETTSFKYRVSGFDGVLPQHQAQVLGHR